MASLTAQTNTNTNNANTSIASTPSMRMLQPNNQNSWRSPFLLDPSIPSNNTMSNIKSEQVHYGYPNNGYPNTNLGANSTAAAAAAAAMFYPIELGDSSMFGKINVPFSSNGTNSNSNFNSSQPNNSATARQVRPNASSHSINGKSCLSTNTC